MRRREDRELDCAVSKKGKGLEGRYLLWMWPKSTRFWLGGTSWPGNATYERSAQGQLLKA